MLPINLKKLREHPQLLHPAALWFSQTWGIPLQAYEESMQACIARQTGVPQWYVLQNEHGAIVAGAGVIENDFHDRKDLAPNLCALFVEPALRGQGVARQILDFARRDMGGMGIETLYLVTDHTEFYERCGWHFFATVHDDEGAPERMYAAPTL